MLVINELEQQRIPSTIKKRGVTAISKAIPYIMPNTTELVKFDPILSEQWMDDFDQDDDSDDQESSYDENSSDEYYYEPN